MTLSPCPRCGAAVAADENHCWMCHERLWLREKPAAAKPAAQPAPATAASAPSPLPSAAGWSDPAAAPDPKARGGLYSAFGAFVVILALAGGWFGLALAVLLVAVGGVVLLSSSEPESKSLLSQFLKGAALLLLCLLAVAAALLFTCFGIIGGFSH